MATSMKIEILQWSWILAIGFFTSIQNWTDDVYKVVVTIVSMVLGTVASWAMKKYLNRRK